MQCSHVTRNQIATDALVMHQKLVNRANVVSSTTQARQPSVVPSTTQGKTRTFNDIIVHPIYQTVIAVFGPADGEGRTVNPQQLRGSPETRKRARISRWLARKYGRTTWFEQD